jgi:hypothetical protein
MPPTRHALVEAGQRWLEEQLRLLEHKTYTGLAALPAKTPLETPPQLAGLKFYISRRPGDAGGIEISARQYKRFLFIETSLGPSFEMLPDGEVIRHEFHFDPDD